MCPNCVEFLRMKIEFYIFLPPYSIYFWDKLNQLGIIDRQLDMEEYAIELLLKSKNILPSTLTLTY